MFSPDGKDLGYQDRDDWWYKGKDRFRIADLNKDYPEHYFTVAGVPEHVVKAYCSFVVLKYTQITNKTLPGEGRSIAEFGAGGGWFTKYFIAMGLKGMVAYEGSAAGCRAMELAEGPELPFVQYDIREVHGPLMHKYPIAVCSELLEHVEPPFHAIAVYNLVGHSDLVWFSSEDPEVVHNQPHTHHAGEFPLEYWKIIFNWHNYGCLMLPDSVYEATAGRGRCIFYNRLVHEENIQKYLQLYGE